VKSISEREYMSKDAQQMAVALLPDSIDPEGIRCHELARAVQRELYGRFIIQAVDGKYANVDHSWCYLSIASGYVLDVYAVGRLPQVQLIQMHPLLKKQTELFEVGQNRTDIRRKVLEAMDEHLRRVFKPRMTRLENKRKA
jgi:hypothetical protein